MKRENSDTPAGVTRETKRNESTTWATIMDQRNTNGDTIFIACARHHPPSTNDQATDDEGNNGSDKGKNGSDNGSTCTNASTNGNPGNGSADAAETAEQCLHVLLHHRDQLVHPYLTRSESLRDGATTFTACLMAYGRHGYRMANYILNVGGVHVRTNRGLKSQYIRPY